jgi:hypothetical protein
MHSREDTLGSPWRRDRRGGRDLLRRLVVFLWLGTLLLVCGRGLVAARAHSVYPIFAGAARHWLAGANLYQPTEEPYRYSPLVAVLLVPFSLLPDGLGGVAWRLLNAGVFLGAVGWWSRAVFGPGSGSRQTLLFLLILPLSVGSLNNGQSNALVVGLLLAAVASVSSGRWRLAAGCTALATLFKLYPIAVGLLLAVAYPRRFAGRLVLALALGLALPFALQEPRYVQSQYAGWLYQLQTDHRQNLPVELWYRDFRLLCHSCGVPLGDSGYAAVQLLAAAGIAAVTVAGRRAGWDRQRLLRTSFALACCWMTLLGPATESCTYILLAPALAGALLDGWRGPWWLRGGLLAGYGLLVAAQVAVWFPFGRQVHTAGPQPMGALLAFLCLLAAEGILPFMRRARSASDFAVEGRAAAATISPSAP